MHLIVRVQLHMGPQADDEMPALLKQCLPHVIADKAGVRHQQGSFRQGGRQGAELI